MEIEVLLIKTDQPTLARNFYLYELVKKAVECDIIQNRILNDSLYGEAETPSSYSLYEDMIRINLSNATHLIKKVYFKDRDLYGIIEILPTKIGKDLESLIAQGTNIRFGLRGIGEAEYVNGINWVSSLKIITFDWIV